MELSYGPFINGRKSMGNWGGKNLSLFIASFITGDGSHLVAAMAFFFINTFFMHSVENIVKINH